jgi:hypothetical protein
MGPFPGRCPLGRRGLARRRPRHQALADEPGHFGHGRGVDEGPDVQLDREGPPDARHDPQGLQGHAAQVEEVVVEVHRVPMEGFRPDGRHRRFDGGARRRCWPDAGQGRGRRSLGYRHLD